MFLILNIHVCLEKLGRFAKRKLDELVFLGNRLKVSYASQFESLADTKDKLETRRKEVLARLNCEHFSFFLFLHAIMCEACDGNICVKINCLC